MPKTHILMTIVLEFSMIVINGRIKIVKKIHKKFKQE